MTASVPAPGWHLAGVLGSAMLLALPQFLLESDWAWPLLALAWVPWGLVLPATAWVCWLEGALLLLVSGLPLLLGAAAGVGLAPALAALGLLALLGALPLAAYPVWRRCWGSGWAFSLALAGVWLIEQLRSMTPANWMSYADPLGEGSLAAPVVAAFGAAGAGLLLLQINALAVAVVGVAGCSWWRSWRRGLPCLLLLLALVYLPWLCASWPVAAGAGNGVASAPALRVAQVAPLIAPGMTESERDKAARLLDAYRQLDPAAIDLALLPQSAFDGVDWQRSEDLRWVLSAVAARGIPLLAGARQIVQRAAADGSGTEISYNVAVLLLPMQARQWLDGGDAAMGNAALPWQGKRYLVPLSEYTPEWLPEWLGRPQQARLSTYIAAAQSRPLPLPVGIDKEMSLGVMLCYDAYHPNVADDLHRAGAEVLLVVSSDLSFSGSALSRQGLRTARLRAMEQGLPLLRIAWSEYGSSAFGADGETLPPIAGAWPAGVRVYALPKPEGSGVRGGRSKAMPGA